MNEKIRAAIRFSQKALNLVFEIEKENIWFLPAFVHENTSSIAEMVLEISRNSSEKYPHHLGFTNSQVKIHVLFFLIERTFEFTPTLMR
jgi:hypothetical protein